jgi:aminopeptidase N
MRNFKVFLLRFENIFMKKPFNTFYFIIFSLLITLKVSSQPFSKQDYLHGKLTKLRSSFDVKMYEITVKVNIEQKYISGKNNITFLALNDLNKIQIDFKLPMQIEKVEMDNTPLLYEQDSNAYFIKFPNTIKKGSKATVSVYFKGNPPVAKNAPWDGGFVFSKDSANKPWVGLACEGLGAYSWLPCKDHLSDEAETMIMHLQVPNGLTGVSNGKLIGRTPLPDGYTQFDWKTSYPINNYNITINIADYVQIQDDYRSPLNGILVLNYHVLRENEQKAKVHFKQVKDMMACFERFFTPYPFWNDGYKLVETPYWGMEHQSCVAYGNDYKNNEWGFDFIIVHESGHEWFGNNLSMKDHADIWIHESFTTYSEAVYVEFKQGYDQAVKYLNSQRHHIKNLAPIIAPRDVYFHGRTDNDVYYKGTWMLHTMRNMLNSDTCWFNMLYELNDDLKHQTLTSADVENYISKRTRYNFAPFFNQYLRKTALPVFEYQIIDKDDKLELKYRLKTDVSGLEMPIKVMLGKNKFEYIIPANHWKIVELQYSSKENFKVDTENFLIEVKDVK